jgi:hypothetical protein
MCIYNFLVRMTDTMTSQNIDLSSWDTVDTDWCEKFMKYAAEMGSVAITYIRNFIKIDSAIQKLMGGGGDTQRAR